MSRHTATSAGFHLMKGKRELLSEMLLGHSSEINGPGKPKEMLSPH